MLGQLQYPPILRLQKGVQEVADVQDAIREYLPGFAVEQQLQITMPPSGKAETATSSAYRFTNEEETWSALLTQTAFTIEAAAGGSYSSYADFAALFRRVWPVVAELLRPARVTQQGLRYVNHIERDCSPEEWSDWINPVLLGGVTSAELGTDLEQAITESVYKLDDGRIVLRYGIGRAGPVNAKGFLVDVDSIHTPPANPRDTDALMARFDESHDAIHRLFRWAVTDYAIEVFRHAG
jgi:uncharacterized protein (TIGR04255 family)